MTTQSSTTQFPVIRRFPTFMAMMAKLDDKIAAYLLDQSSPFRGDIEEHIRRIKAFREQALTVTRAKIEAVIAEKAKIDVKITERQQEAPRLRHELHLLQGKLPKLRQRLEHNQSQVHLDRPTLANTAALSFAPQSRKDLIAELERQIVELETQVTAKDAELQTALAPQTPHHKAQVTRSNNLEQKIGDLWELRHDLRDKLPEMIHAVRTVIGWIDRKIKPAGAQTVNALLLATGSEPAMNPILADLMEREKLDPSNPEDVELAVLLIADKPVRQSAAA